MERLTFEGNFCDIAQCDVIPGGSYCESGSCTQRKVWERLAAYEDTGLTPERCAEFARADAEGRYIVMRDTKQEGVARLRELADAYKEAQVAIEVGRVFESEKTIINYESLGLGRIIYQLPTTLCEMFLNEVFKKNPIETLDEDTLETINKFFENNLNVSETSRKLYVHRNTLVYRLEKIKKITGLDLREFDHAIVFKVAMMVKMYLDSLNSSKY